MKRSFPLLAGGGGAAFIAIAPGICHATARDGPLVGCTGPITSPLPSAHSWLLTLQRSSGPLALPGDSKYLPASDRSPPPPFLDFWRPLSHLCRIVAHGREGGAHRLRQKFTSCPPPHWPGQLCLPRGSRSHLGILDGQLGVADSNLKSRV